MPALFRPPATAGGATFRPPAPPAAAETPEQAVERRERARLAFKANRMSPTLDDPRRFAGEIPDPPPERGAPGRTELRMCRNRHLTTALLDPDSGLCPRCSGADMWGRSTA
jgi:hypothetical protein